MPDFAARLRRAAAIAIAALLPVFACGAAYATANAPGGIGGSVPAPGAGKPAAITVVLDDNYPPYIFRDGSGQLAGIRKDMWQLWQAHTGIRVDLRAMDWGKARQTMEAGSADVIDTIFETDERKKQYRFSAPYATIDVPIFFHKTISGISSEPASLSGFTIGVKDGDACIDTLHASGIDTVRRYPSFETLIKAAGNNEVRLLCIDKPPADYLFTKLGLADQFRFSAPLYVGQFHWAVAIDRPAMLALVEDGFATISAAERQAIDDKWLGSAMQSSGWQAIARNAAYAGAGVVLLAALLLLWNASLRRRVREKTAALSNAIGALEQAKQKAEATLVDHVATLEAIPDLLFEIDSEGRYFDFHAAQPERMRVAATQLIGHTVHEVAAADTAATVMQALREAAASGVSHGHVIGDGAAEPLWYELSVARKKAANAGNERFIMLARDVTARTLAESALLASEQKLATILDNVTAFIYLKDKQGCYLYANRPVRELFGAAMEDIVGRSDEAFFDENTANALHATDCAILAEGITFRSEESNVSLLTGIKHTYWSVKLPLRRPDGEIYALCGISTDITDRKKSEELMWAQANVDALTGLPNRRMFIDRLQQEVKKSNRANLPMALMFLDLDHFKDVNDTLGHAMGDLLLQEAARRLRGCVREIDTVARLGGDEFTVILGELGDVDVVERVTANILQKLAEPFQLGDEVAYITSSIGITLYPADAGEIDALQKNADQAMYAAKTQGRNRSSYFTRSMQETAQKRRRMVGDLRRALTERQFELAYQPIVDLKTGAIGKAEALIRWRHPERGLVAPNEFISIAEETGLIVDIGDWVFQQAAAQAAQWRAAYHPQFQVSVNVSPVQFQVGDSTLALWLTHLESIGLPAGAIVVEITEGLLLDTGAAITDQLLTLRDAGVQVSLDDFGTGYSSLSYLKKFDIDYIKIDQAFVRNLAPGSDDMALSEAMIVMAHKLGLKVIAEGVETAQQRDLLHAAGCDYGQGYLFAKPLTALQMSALLDRRAGL